MYMIAFLLMWVKPAPAKVPCVVVLVAPIDPAWGHDCEIKVVTRRFYDKSQSGPGPWIYTEVGSLVLADKDARLLDTY